MSTTITTPVISPKNAKANVKTIQITERALRKIRSAMAKENVSLDDGGVRLALEGGGCFGLSYNVSFDREPKQRDRIYDFDGIRVFIDPKSFIYLHGMLLDYEESPLRRGFNVIDPNSSKSCGCGSTFSA
ncbi:MAG TPA: iron-sulfur cluster assembly accessory protein [Terriglobales bacterium]